MHLLWGDRPFLRAGYVGRRGRTLKVGWFKEPRRSQETGTVHVATFCGLRKSAPGFDYAATRRLDMVQCSRCLANLDRYFAAGKAVVRLRKGVQIVVLLFTPSMEQVATAIANPESVSLEAPR